MIRRSDCDIIIEREQRRTGQVEAPLLTKDSSKDEISKEPNAFWALRGSGDLLRGHRITSLKEHPILLIIYIIQPTLLCIYCFCDATMVLSVYNTISNNNNRTLSSTSCSGPADYGFRGSNAATEAANRIYYRSDISSKKRRCSGGGNSYSSERSSSFNTTAIWNGLLEEGEAETFPSIEWISDDDSCDNNYDNEDSSSVEADDDDDEPSLHEINSSTTTQQTLKLHHRDTKKRRALKRCAAFQESLSKMSCYEGGEDTSSHSNPLAAAAAAADCVVTPETIVCLVVPETSCLSLLS